MIDETTKYEPPAAQGKALPKDMMAHSYLLRVTPILCTCGSQHQNIETFKVYVHPSLTRSTGLRDLRPVTEAQADLPIGHTILQPRRVAFCPSCVNIDRPGDVPLPAPITDAAWARAIKASQQPPKAVSTVSTPKPQTAADIDF